MIVISTGCKLNKIYTHQNYKNMQLIVEHIRLSLNDRGTHVNNNRDIVVTIIISSYDNVYR